MGLFNKKKTRHTKREGGFKKHATASRKQREKKQTVAPIIEEPLQGEMLPSDTPTKTQEATSVVETREVSDDEYLQVLDNLTADSNLTAAVKKDLLERGWTPKLIEEVFDQRDEEILSKELFDESIPNPESERIANDLITTSKKVDEALAPTSPEKPRQEEKESVVTTNLTELEIIGAQYREFQAEAETQLRAGKSPRAIIKNLKKTPYGKENPEIVKDTVNTAKLIIADEKNTIGATGNAESNNPFTEKAINMIKTSPKISDEKLQNTLAKRAPKGRKQVKLIRQAIEEARPIANKQRMYERIEYDLSQSRSPKVIQENLLKFHFTPEEIKAAFKQKNIGAIDPQVNIEAQIESKSNNELVGHDEAVSGVFNYIVEQTGAGRTKQEIEEDLKDTQWVQELQDKNIIIDQAFNRAEQELTEMPQRETSESVQKSITTSRAEINNVEPVAKSLVTQKDLITPTHPDWYKNLGMLIKDIKDRKADNPDLSGEEIIKSFSQAPFVKKHDSKLLLDAAAQVGINLGEIPEIKPIDETDAIIIEDDEVIMPLSEVKVGENPVLPIEEEDLILPIPELPAEAATKQEREQPSIPIQGVSDKVDALVTEPSSDDKPKTTNLKKEMDKARKLTNTRDPHSIIQSEQIRTIQESRSQLDDIEVPKARTTGKKTPDKEIPTLAPVPTDSKPKLTSFLYKKPNRSKLIKYSIPSKEKLSDQEIDSAWENKYQSLSEQTMKAEVTENPAIVEPKEEITTVKPTTKSDSEPKASYSGSTSTTKLNDFFKEVSEGSFQLKILENLNAKVDELFAKYETTHEGSDDETAILKQYFAQLEELTNFAKKYGTKLESGIILNETFADTLYESLEKTLGEKPTNLGEAITKYIVKMQKLSEKVDYTNERSEDLIKYFREDLAPWLDKLRTELTDARGATDKNTKGLEDLTNRMDIVEKKVETQANTLTETNEKLEDLTNEVNDIGDAVEELQENRTPTLAAYVNRRTIAYRRGSSTGCLI
jgi:hypothetical protein